VVVVADRHNVVLVSDSRLTALSDLKPCDVRGPELGCKAVLVRKDVLIAVAGDYRLSDQGKPWLVTEEAKTLLEKLPKDNLSKEDIDRFSAEWGRKFSSYLFTKQSHDHLPITNNPKLSLGAILVVTRIEGKPYIARVEIGTYPNGRDIFANETEGHVEESDTTATFAGSCTIS
jgi:hypothetical protein